ncbi:MAG: hypothetical protein IPO17_09620 [Flavobacteriales bacterium]|nr:hypothetical protein [Flavobacteriales bacterium]
MRAILLLSTAILTSTVTAQTNLVTYAGGSGNEVFNDVVQISDGRVLVIGVADDLGWIDTGVPQFNLGASGITNGLGTGKFPFILVFDSTLQIMLSVHAMTQGAAEDLRFIKLTNAPGTPTGDIYLSGTTEDANTGGYFIGRLDNNFVNGDPSGFEWVINVKCSTGEYPKIYQPWDVGGDGKVVYAYGDSHSYNWSAIYRNKADGSEDVVPFWRIHWPIGRRAGTSRHCIHLSQWWHRQFGVQRDRIEARCLALRVAQPNTSRVRSLATRWQRRNQEGNVAAGHTLRFALLARRHRQHDQWPWLYGIQRQRHVHARSPIHLHRSPHQQHVHRLQHQERAARWPARFRTGRDGHGRRWRVALVEPSVS